MVDLDKDVGGAEELKGSCPHERHSCRPLYESVTGGIGDFVCCGRRQPIDKEYSFLNGLPYCLCMVCPGTDTLRFYNEPQLRALARVVRRAFRKVTDI